MRLLNYIKLSFSSALPDVYVCDIRLSLKRTPFISFCAAFPFTSVNRKRRRSPSDFCEERSGSSSWVTQQQPFISLSVRGGQTHPHKHTDTWTLMQACTDAQRHTGGHMRDCFLQPPRFHHSTSEENVYLWDAQKTSNVQRRRRKY